MGVDDTEVIVLFDDEEAEEAEDDDDEGKLPPLLIDGLGGLGFKPKRLRILKLPKPVPPGAALTVEELILSLNTPAICKDKTNVRK